MSEPRTKADGSRERSRDYQRVATAIRFIQERAREQPTLEEVADHLDLSPFHVQRLFSRWAGVSPKRFLQFLTLKRAKELLGEGRAVLESSYAAGLSGPGRLHDLFVTLEGVTPGEFKEGGRGLEIRWGVRPTPFGDAFLATTERGVCALSFLEEEKEERDRALDALEESWPGAILDEDSHGLGGLVERMFENPGRTEERALNVHVRGTNFQLRVWEALLSVPPGRAVTYGDLARAVGNPDGARAVGGAVGANPVAVLIPCHRVLRSTGHFGGYRWGTERKKALLAWERAAAG